MIFGKFKRGENFCQFVHAILLPMYYIVSRAVEKYRDINIDNIFAWISHAYYTI